MCDNEAIYPSSHSVNMDNWLEFYFGDPLAIRFRQIVQSLINHSILNPSNSFDAGNTVIVLTVSFYCVFIVFGFKIISKTLSVVLDLIEKNESFVEPANVGMRPKFLYKMFCQASQKVERPITRNAPKSNRFNHQPNSKF